MRGINYLGFVIASVMMLVLVAYAASSMLDFVAPEIQEQSDSKKEARAYEIFLSLVSSPGSWSGGTNWETNPAQIERLGLANKYSVLSVKKLEAMERLNKNQLRTLLGDEFNYEICVDQCELYRMSTSDAIETTDEKFIQFPVMLDNGKVTNLRVVVR